MTNTRLSVDPLTPSSVVFHEGGSEIIRIDSQGFYYRDQFIRDAGEAHYLLVEYLRRHLPDTDWKHAK